MILFNAPINDTSYGIVSKNILKELRKRTEVAVFPIGKMHSGDWLTSLEITHAMDKKTLDLPTLKIWHQFGMNESISNGRQVGYTFFEMDQLTKWELACLRCLDLLVCPTSWQAGVCHDSGYEGEITIIPPGYDPEIFKPIDFFPKKCVFLSIGKWEVRKQQDIIVEAFRKAFPKEQDVSLWISCENRFLGEDFNTNKRRQYQKRLGDRFKWLSRVNSHEDIARIIQQSYCFVAPSLAEGFNMPLLESMACNKEIIATNYSGHTEFLTDKCLKIEITGKEKAEDGMWFNRNLYQNCGYWATYDFDDLVDAMRQTYGQWQGGVVSGTAECVKDLTWANTAEEFQLCLTK